MASAVLTLTSMNLLLAVDNSTCSSAAIDAVRHQFDPATTTVRVLHVIEWPHDLPTSVAFAEGPHAADAVLFAHQKIRQTAERLVRCAAAELKAFNATGVVVEGDVRTEIVEAAAEWPADVIVLGSHGRTGIDWLLLGSVSHAVLRRADCPVHIVGLERTPASSLSA